MIARFWLLMVLAALCGARAEAQPAPGPHVAMRLVAESETPAPGSSVALAFVSVPQPGWHGYWKNPGAVGVEATLNWTLPAGVVAGPLQYPVPQRLLVAGIMNYVYERPWTQIATLRIPPGLATGTRLPVRVRIDYLVCTREVCVPERRTLETELTVGDGRIDPARRAQFDRWRLAMPRPLGSQATFAVSGQGSAARFRMAVPFPASVGSDGAYFYPLTDRAIAYDAQQSVTRDGDTLTIETAAGPAVPGRVEGVLATGSGQGFAIMAVPGTVVPAHVGGWAVAALLAFGGALLGGLVLNVMPCVFPILSLKALALARAGTTEREARVEAVAYTAGVVLVCVGLGAVLLGLRAGGIAAGWAFQLQDPRVILLLLLLVAAIALNLAGLFELPTPRFAGRSGAGGAFATGALAAFVATPCTGPFMGAALAAALVLPTAAALAVFAGLGIGLAVPFLLLGFVPALRRRLPRPGAWMERLRRILSLPMFLTALALAWILGQEAGVDAMTLGLGAMLVFACGLWWTGRRQLAGVGRQWWPAACALAGALPMLALIEHVPAADASPAPGAEPFTEARLAALRAGGKPVFAYFTADWCLTCKVNDKGAIETAAVSRAFRAGRVDVLVGDWTDGDPEIGRFIEAHGRAGVPLYLWYSPGSTVPTVLPQILTQGMLTALADPKR